MRYRHDGFTAKKRRRFLKTLGKTGCISDGARAAGISTTTVDRWRRKDAAFAKACEAAIDMASSHIETLAWERAVTGIEEPVWYYGKQVGTRIKRSDAIFRMLLMASNAGKYGRMGAAAQGQGRAAIRKEVRSEILAEERSKRKARQGEMLAEIERRLDTIRDRYIAKGFVELPDGTLVAPPGLIPDPDRNGPRG